VTAWAGPRIAAAERAEAERLEVEREAQRPAECGERCACQPPPGGFRALVASIAARRSYGGDSNG